MTHRELLRLARMGAQARLTELQQELELIRKHFPELRANSVGKAARNGRTAPVRRRKRLSAAARNAISQAQKQRWAEWRKKRKAG